MSGDGRLDGPGFGLLIDRTKPLTFTFDGGLFNGYDGDVVASALYAEGQILLSRSFKYHRPRGALTMAGHDANTLVQIADEPNVRADRHPVSAGLAVTSVNRLGSLSRDVLAILDRLGRFLPVGFYYRTFFQPAWAWRLWEKPIRRLAGLGHLEPNARTRYYDKSHLFCDVLVAGGGPAGLEAAIAAAEAGADVILADEWPALGGSLLYARGHAGGAETEASRQSLLARAHTGASLRPLTSATVSGLFADGWASIIQGNRLMKVRARSTIIATGASEQLLVFRNNDRPGTIFADAAQRLLRLYGVRPGRRAVIATSNRFGYEAAHDLLDAGVEVAAIVDLHPVPDAALAEAARARGMRIIPGSTIVDTKGTMRVEQVGVSQIIGEGRTASGVEWIGCDVVAIGVGYQPALGLASLAGAHIVYDEATHMHRATDLPRGILIAGSAAGLWQEDLVREHARRTGLAAAAAANSSADHARSSASADVIAPADPSAGSITHPFPIFASSRGKDFVDLDEDLSVKDIADTVRLGYDDIQLVKRFSTAGLGPSQGRHAHLNTIRLVARATGKSLASIGTTTFRPPVVPEKLAHMAGRPHDPVRLTPMHHRHTELGAKMMVAGAWLRPAYYVRGRTPPADLIASEVRAVREGAGIIDVSTLGGIDIRGADAAAFVDRMYTWAHAGQAVGRARYALMTDMTGVIIDDGVACRFHDRHFYVTATTGGVDQVYRAMTWFQAQWRMDVDIANVTAAYAGVNLAGPRAREALTTLTSDIDFSRGAFPYLGVRTGTLADIPVRVLRVGFVGELGYEIHCPSGMGEALWDKLLDAGKAAGLRPFGVEAQRVLRLEKGHIIVGQDTDGLTHPHEAGMEWALARKKPFFVGKRSIEMQAAKGLSRKLVGFTLADPAAPTPKECHLVIRDGDIAGRVTSVARSPTLARVIGLAYVPPDLAEPGSQLEIRADGGTMVRAVVTRTPFYDPESKRQEM